MKKNPHLLGMDHNNQPHENHHSDLLFSAFREGCVNPSTPWGLTSAPCAV